MDPYAWSWNAEAFVVVGMTVAYVAAVRREPSGTWRMAAFGGAMALLLAVSVTPIHTLGMHYLLTVHLLQNVVLAEWAPLLVVLAIPPAFAASIARLARFERSPIPRSRFPSGSGTTCSGICRGSTTPRFGTRTRCSISSTSLLRDGSCDVVVCVPGRAAPARGGGRAAYVFAGFVLASPIGLVMALVPDAIYEFYVEAHHRVWGLGPLEDQQLARDAHGARAGDRLLRRVRILVLPLPRGGGAPRGRRSAAVAA